MSIKTPRAHLPVAHAFAAVAAALAAVLGAGALLGWITGIELLKSFLAPGRIAMNPATAICFILGGSALWFAREPKRTRSREFARLVLAGAMVLVAGSKVLDLFPRVDVDVDEMLFRATLGDNRMAPNTAVAFLLVACSLLL